MRTAILTAVAALAALAAVGTLTQPDAFAAKGRVVDAHLHDSTFQIKDKDTVEQSSTVYANGKANPELKAVLHRRASSN